MINRITIIGLGLIGGSLTKAFKRTNPDFFITGVDPNPEYASMALKDSSIDKIEFSIEKAVKDTQAIFLCIPVKEIDKVLKEALPFVKPETIITDVGSVKSNIMKNVASLLPENIYFIGGHPMAGTENSGYDASVAHLFENAYYVLTPLPDTPAYIIDTLKTLISSTGAMPIIMDAGVHDKMVGAISHLPHVLASSLVNVVRSIDDPDEYLVKLAAGGFKDITRIASSNPLMWRDISLLNKNQLIPLLNNLIENLSDFKEKLVNDNYEEMKSFFKDAKAFRDYIPDHGVVHLLPYFEIYVDIEDKPGLIGQVATILGEKGINIKNIRIINSREDEPGCLVLSLPTRDAQKSALKVLLENGFRTYPK